MANSREAQFQWDLIEAMKAYGCKAGTAGGCDHKEEGGRELELTHYRLTKREEKRLRLEEAEGDYGLTQVSEVGSGNPLDPEKQRLAEYDDKLHLVNGIADRIECDEVVMAQVRHHSEDDVMHGLVPEEDNRRPERPREAQHAAVGRRKSRQAICVVDSEVVGWRGRPRREFKRVINHPASAHL